MPQVGHLHVREPKDIIEGFVFAESFALMEYIPTPLNSNAIWFIRWNQRTGNVLEEDSHFRLVFAVVDALVLVHVDFGIVAKVFLV